MKKTLILFIGALLLFVFIGFSYTNKVVCREGLTTPVISDPNNYISKDSHAPGVEEGTAWEWDADVVDGHRDGTGDDHLGTAKGGFVCPAGACYRPGTYNLCAYNDSSSSKCDTGYVDGSGQQWGNGWVKNPWYGVDRTGYWEKLDEYESKPNRYWCPSDSCFDISTNVCKKAGNVDASGLAICGKDGIVGNGRYYSVKLDHDISESMDILAANWENAGCTTGTHGHQLTPADRNYSNWWLHQTPAMTAKDAHDWCADAIILDSSFVQTTTPDKPGGWRADPSKTGHWVKSCFGGADGLNSALGKALDASSQFQINLQAATSDSDAKSKIVSALCKNEVVGGMVGFDVKSAKLIDAAKEWFLKKKTTAKKNVEYKKIEDYISKLIELDATDMAKRKKVLDELDADAAALSGKPTTTTTAAPTTTTAGPTTTTTAAPTTTTTAAPTTTTTAAPTTTTTAAPKKKPTTDTIEHDPSTGSGDVPHNHHVPRSYSNKRSGRTLNFTCING
jgi:hypothetical protein